MINIGQFWVLDILEQHCCHKEISTFKKGSYYYPQRTVSYSFPTLPFECVWWHTVHTHISQHKPTTKHRTLTTKAVRRNKRQPKIKKTKSHQDTRLSRPPLWLMKTNIGRECSRGTEKQHKQWSRQQNAFRARAHGPRVQSENNGRREKVGSERGRKDGRKRKRGH